MSAAASNREMAAVARRAAEIIVERGKATGVGQDRLGRVCAIRALVLACGDLGMPDASPAYTELFHHVRARVAGPDGSLATWSDLLTTTNLGIAKVFLQVADDLEAAP